MGRKSRRKNYSPKASDTHLLQKRWSASDNFFFFLGSLKFCGPDMSTNEIIRTFIKLFYSRAVKPTKSVGRINNS